MHWHCGCCVEWHRTMRVAIIAVVSLLHGLVLAVSGALPLT